MFLLVIFSNFLTISFCFSVGIQAKYEVTITEPINAILDENNPKDINREEVYQQFYQETADFVMKKFQLTLDEAYSYINMNQSYYKTIEIKIAEIIIETNLSKDRR